MRFAAYLNAGTSPQQVAELVVEELLRSSDEDAENEVCLTFAIQFVQSNLALINFQCGITIQQVIMCKYEWPERLRSYTFSYDAKLFRPFGKFLRHISKVIFEKQQSFDLGIQNASGSSENSLGKSPVFLYLKLLDIWYSVSNDLERQESNMVSPRFEEPLARINYNLLMGLHPVRKQFRLQIGNENLDAVCHRLYKSAVKGLFYAECHVEFVSGLSTLFSQDFDLFHNYSADSMDFFFESLSVLKQNDTYIKVFEIFQEMLYNPSLTEGQLLILTNYLIEQKMQEVYFTFIKFSKTKRLLLNILKFLKILQSKLPTVECFSKAFIESFWVLLLKKDKQISSLAADTYITIMNRKFDKKLILHHILEGYFQQMNSTDSLSDYIETMWQSFPNMNDVDVYITVITKSNTTEMFRVYTAHFLVEVYKQMQKNHVKYYETLKLLLLILPELLKKLSCEITVGVLMQIYPETNFEYIKCYAPENCWQIFQVFENFAMSSLENALYSYPLMLCIIAQLSRCLHYTRNWATLERTANTVYIRFREIENKLNEKKVTISTRKDYFMVLEQLTVLLKTGYNLFDDLTYILQCIQTHLIDDQKIYEFASKDNTLCDVYAIEILTFGLRTLAVSAETTSEKLFVKNSIDKLSKHLLNILSQIKDATEMSLLHIKTVYCCFVHLHFIFRKGIRINLTAQSYHILVAVLVLINFNTKSFLDDADDLLYNHALRKLEYQKMMFDEFIRLHSTEHIQIPSNIAWKLCIYFGLPNHNFHDQLAQLLKVIAAKHLSIYKHILPVILFRLYEGQRELSMHTIQKAIKVHNDFIVSQLKDQNPYVLKLHIILTVLQILNKHTTVVSSGSGISRVVALKHLNILVADFKWSDKTVIEIIFAYCIISTLMKILHENGSGDGAETLVASAYIPLSNFNGINQAKKILENTLTTDEETDLFKFIKYYENYLKH